MRLAPQTVLAAGLLLSSTAQALDYRQVTLTDGRAFVAEVVTQTEDGLELTVPPGSLTVSHSQVAALAPSDPNAYLEQPDWRVLVLEGADHRAVMQTIQELPGLKFVDPKHPDEFDPDDLVTALACGADLACAATVLYKAPWIWLVSPTKRKGKIIELHGRLNTEHVGYIGAYVKGDDDARSRAAILSVGIVPTTR